MSMTKGLLKLPDNFYREARWAAKYQEEPVEIHRGNPLLEALPAAVDDRRFYASMAQKPKYDEGVRQLPPHQRKQMLQNLTLFFQPLPRHRILESDIADLICSGYLTRNPVDPLLPGTLLDRVGQLEQDAPVVRPVSSLRSGMLTGLPGTGKSQSLARILSRFPQVIHHTEYNGRPLSHDQVTWLKLECPSDASSRALCLSFFQQLDWLLGTNYLESYEGSHSATSTMVPALGRVALLHSLGLLVIDEVQHLCKNETHMAHAATPKEKQKLIKFIVQVVNTLGVPVLLVGNSSFLDFLGSSAHLVRRGTGLQNPHWMRFKRQDPEWKVFSRALWKYQYTKVETKLEGDDALGDEFYNQTQGLPDYAVKLYEGVQKHLIDQGKDEVITPEVLRMVARQKLAPSIPFLSALREGDYEFLKGLNTVHPIDIFGSGSREALTGWPKTRFIGRKYEDAKKVAEKNAKMSNIQMPDEPRD